MSLLSYILGSDEQQQRGDSLDAQLKALNDRDYGKGGRIYNEIQEEQGPAAAIIAAQDVQKHLESSKTGNVSAQIDQAFDEGLADSTSSVRNAIGTAVGSIFRIIPLSVWILAAVALFVYMGGWVWLKGRLARS